MERRNPFDFKSYRRANATLGWHLHMRWLAYLHPVAMLAVLLLGLLAARQGLRLRRARLGGRERIPVARHTRLARPFVLLVAAGYPVGLFSMGWIRGEEIYASPHAAIATAASILLLVAGALGWSLERGHGPRWARGPRARSVHLVLGGSGLLAALAAAVAGFDILP